MARVHFWATFTFTVGVTLFLRLVLLVHATEGGRGCDPLLYREGVRVTCRTDAPRTRVDCYGTGKRVPTGTVATYGCETPYYVPIQRQELSAGRRRSLTLKCNEYGKWAGGLSRFHLFGCTLNCGVTDVTPLTTFVLGGVQAPQIDWPWHAAIFKRESPSEEFEYACGGSLIKPHGSQEFVVVTAAHCVGSLRSPDRVTRHPDDVRVVLAVEEPRLEDMFGHSPDAEVFRVKEMILHDSYDGGYSAHQADIALIRLAETVKLKPNILPVCLSWAMGRPDVGDVGHVAGFGRYASNVANISTHLRRASFPVVNPERRLQWRSRKLSSQEFCAGTSNHQNACTGDSGGGMVFNATDEYGVSRFYLRGIVSHGRESWNGKPIGCDNFTVYTRLGSYMDWIHETAENFLGGGGEEEEDKDELDNCGITDSRLAAPSFGKEVVQNASDWPWQVGIVKETYPGSFYYVCGGSLVRLRKGKPLVVVTASECVISSAEYFSSNRTGTLNTSETLTILAGFAQLPNLTQLAQRGEDGQFISATALSEKPPGAYFFPVTRAFVLPSRRGPSGKFQESIAVLTFDLPEEPKPPLVPVCLSQSSNFPAVGEVGHLVGFGLDWLDTFRLRKYTSDYLRRLSFPVVKNDLCGNNTKIMSPKFCAGTPDSYSVCTVDAGGGMVFSRKDEHGKDRFYLEGIAHYDPGLALDWPPILRCRFFIYTRVGARLDWIRRTTRKLYPEGEK